MHKPPYQRSQKYYLEGACVPYSPRACRGPHLDEKYVTWLLKPHGLEAAWDTRVRAAGLPGIVFSMVWEWIQFQQIWIMWISCKPWCHATASMACTCLHRLQSGFMVRECYHYQHLNSLCPMPNCYANTGFSAYSQVLNQNMQRACGPWATRVRDLSIPHKAKRYQNLIWERIYFFTLAGIFPICYWSPV